MMCALLLQGETSQTSPLCPLLLPDGKKLKRKNCFFFQTIKITVSVDVKSSDYMAFPAVRIISVTTSPTRHCRTWVTLHRWVIVVRGHNTEETEVEVSVRNDACNESVVEEKTLTLIYLLFNVAAVCVTVVENQSTMLKSRGGKLHPPLSPPKPPRTAGGSWRPQGVVRDASRLSDSDR